MVFKKLGPFSIKNNGQYVSNDRHKTSNSLRTDETDLIDEETWYVYQDEDAQHVYFKSYNNHEFMTVDENGSVCGNGDINCIGSAWMLLDAGNGKYSLKNASTGQYLRSNRETKVADTQPHCGEWEQFEISPVTKWDLSTWDRFNGFAKVAAVVLSSATVGAVGGPAAAGETFASLTAMLAMNPNIDILVGGTISTGGSDHKPAPDTSEGPESKKSEPLETKSPGARGSSSSTSGPEKPPGYQHQQGSENSTRLQGTHPGLVFSTTLEAKQQHLANHGPLIINVPGTSSLVVTIGKDGNTIGMDSDGKIEISNAIYKDKNVEVTVAGSLIPSENKASIKTETKVIKDDKGSSKTFVEVGADGVSRMVTLSFGDEQCEPERLISKTRTPGKIPIETDPKKLPDISLKDSTQVNRVIKALAQNELHIEARLPDTPELVGTHTQQIEISKVEWGNGHLMIKVGNTMTVLYNIDSTGKTSSQVCQQLKTEMSMDAVTAAGLVAIPLAGATMAELAATIGVSGIASKATSEALNRAIQGTASRIAATGAAMSLATQKAMGDQKPPSATVDNGLKVSRSKFEVSKSDSKEPKPKSEEPKPKSEEPKPKSEGPKPKSEEPKSKSEEPKPKQDAAEKKIPEYRQTLIKGVEVERDQKRPVTYTNPDDPLDVLPVRKEEYLEKRSRSTVFKETHDGKTFTSKVVEDVYETRHLTKTTKSGWINDSEITVEKVQKLGSPSVAASRSPVPDTSGTSTADSGPRITFSSSFKGDTVTMVKKQGDVTDTLISKPGERIKIKEDGKETNVVIEKRDSKTTIKEDAKSRVTIKKEDKLSMGMERGVGTLASGIAGMAIQSGLSGEAPQISQVASVGVSTVKNFGVGHCINIAQKCSHSKTTVAGSTAVITGLVVAGRIYEHATSDDDDVSTAQVAGEVAVELVPTMLQVAKVATKIPYINEACTYASVTIDSVRCANKYYNGDIGGAEALKTVGTNAVSTFASAATGAFVASSVLVGGPAIAVVAGSAAAATVVGWGVSKVCSGIWWLFE